MNNEDQLVKEMIDEAPQLFYELTGFRPYKYQTEFLLSVSKRILFRSGRQIGKTEACAIMAIHHALSEPKRLVLNIATSRTQSGIMFRRIRGYLNEHAIYGNQIELDTQTMIIFKNGSEIHCLPGNNPQTIRGYPATLVIIDEAAFVKDGIFEAIYPSLAKTNGRLVLISTPYGKRGEFYKASRNPVFEKYYIPSKMCPDITAEFLKEQKDSRPEMQYLAEYEGEFIEGADSFISRDLLIDVIGECAELKEAPRTAGFNYYLGVDMARYGLDETVYTVVQKSPIGQLEVVKIIATSKKPLTDVIGRVKELHKSFDFQAVYMDATGLGAGVIDVLKEDKIPLKDIKGRFEGVVFTLENKEAMYKNLKMLIEQGRLKIPKHDKLINQLTDLQYEFTQNHMKIHHPDNGHDDYPDSLALACLGSLAKQKIRHYIAG